MIHLCDLAYLILHDIAWPTVVLLVVDTSTSTGPCITPTAVCPPTARILSASSTAITQALMTGRHGVPRPHAQRSRGSPCCQPALPGDPAPSRLSSHTMTCHVASQTPHGLGPKQAHHVPCAASTSPRQPRISGGSGVGIFAISLFFPLVRATACVAGACHSE